MEEFIKEHREHLEIIARNLCISLEEAAKEALTLGVQKLEGACVWEPSKPY
jgi:hypothetical protein